MKECLLGCDLQEGGYCTKEDLDCKATKESDLMTEEEYKSQLAEKVDK